MGNDLVNYRALKKLKEKGFSNPARLIWYLAERLANNEQYDLVNGYIKDEMQRRIIDEDAEIEKLLQELGYKILNREVLQEKLKYLEHEIQSYRDSKEVDALIKKIARKIEFYNLTLINVEDRCADEIRRIKELNPDINIKNVIFTIFQLREMSDKQKNVVKYIENYLGF
ncbi:MAG TPA: hypothetical protein PK024_08500 [Methanospirillum sp.]|uniref:hypothetical protein n=1 Tax=Methanospirillum sp. TaxID=45200 RepID=UPI002CA40585|nr:hypothetical protein [Methanospirillum sp.]HOJ96857.1 hypothetical protein [Methanospirillum sp.]HPP76865.1 hypothetical protein [Methanospirillum sp.]